MVFEKYYSEYFMQFSKCVSYNFYPVKIYLFYRSDIYQPSHFCENIYGKEKLNLLRIRTYWYITKLVLVDYPY